MNDQQETEDITELDKKYGEEKPSAEFAKLLEEAGPEADRQQDVAVGKKVSIEMNGQKTIDTDLSRSLKGHVGLQIHDDDSIVRFRNIRIEQL